MALLVILLSQCFLSTLGRFDGPQINVQQGTLRGSYVETWKGRKVSAFTGIPYAKPPIGDLRFERSVPAEPWEGIFDATKTHPMCTQVDSFQNNFDPTGEEDCLYLNVYVPEVNMSEIESKQLPVMFYIHGGGFVTGSTHPYAHDFLLDKDIILVTINYRLGAMGFISTGDEVVPGNNGLKDQHLALLWTKANIKHFGGDPTRVLIFGESAGAASVHYHIISPLSKGLFSAAAFTSGSSVNAWSLSHNGVTVKNTKKIAELLKCPTDDSKRMIQCLKKMNNKDIASKDQNLMEWSFYPITPFKPVIEPKLEGAFLTEDPYAIIKAGNTSDVPILTGLTTQEGTMLSALLYNNSTLVEELNEDFDRLAPLVFFYRDTAPNVDNVTTELRNFYFGNKQIDDSTKDLVTNIFTDALFSSGADDVVRLHHKYTTKPLFYFQLGYRGSMSLTDVLTTDPAFRNDVCHSDDLFYIFQYIRLMQNTTISETDGKMIDLMVTLYTNFAMTGNPTPQVDDIIKTKWEPVTSTDQEYLFVEGPNKITMKSNLFKERIYFWRRLPTDKRRENL